MEFNRPTVPDPTETLAERTIAGKYSSQNQQRKTTTQAQEPAFDSTLKVGQNNSLYQEHTMTWWNLLNWSRMHLKQRTQLEACILLWTSSEQQLWHKHKNQPALDSILKGAGHWAKYFINSKRLLWLHEIHQNGAGCHSRCEEDRKHAKISE